MPRTNTIDVNWNKMTESFGVALRNGGTKDHILYRMKNKDGKVIRVGACNNLNNRMNAYKTCHSYRSIAGSKTYPRIWKETVTVEYITLKTRALLEILEKKTIKLLQPVYNIIK